MGENHGQKQCSDQDSKQPPKKPNMDTHPASTSVSRRQIASHTTFLTLGALLLTAAGAKLGCFGLATVCAKCGYILDLHHLHHLHLDIVKFHIRAIPQRSRHWRVKSIPRVSACISIRAFRSTDQLRILGGTRGGGRGATFEPPHRDRNQYHYTDTCTNRRHRRTG